MPHRMTRRSMLVEPSPYLSNQTGYTTPFHAHNQRASTAATRSFSASEADIPTLEVIGPAHGVNLPSYPIFDTQSPYFDPRSEASTYPPRPIASSSTSIAQSPYFDPRPTYPSTTTSSVDDAPQFPSTWPTSSANQYTLQPTSYNYNPHPLPLSPFDTSVPLPTWSSSIPYSDWPALPSTLTPSTIASVPMISTTAKPPSTSSFGLHPSYSHSFSHSNHTSQSSIPSFGYETLPQYHGGFQSSRTRPGSSSTSNSLLFSPMGEIQEASAVPPAAPYFDYARTYPALPPPPSYSFIPPPQTPTAPSFDPTSSDSANSSPHATTPPSRPLIDQPHFDCPKFELDNSEPIKRGRKPKSDAGSGESAQEWDHVADRAERRRIQNKLAQRIYRARHQNLGRKRLVAPMRIRE